MFPQIGRVENFLSLTRPQNQICIRTNIFNLKNNKTDQKEVDKKKTKETKEEKRITSLEFLLVYNLNLM